MRSIRCSQSIQRRGIVESLERRVLLTLVYSIDTTDDSGVGSLRGAIEFANGNSGTDTIIRFDGLRGSGVQTIKPLSALPAITVRVDIQGATDANGDPLIEIDGSSAGASVDGLTFNRNTPNDSKPSLVSGLIIDRFSGNGISIGGNEPTNIFGCLIGVDPTGRHAHPNGGDGIFVNTPGCQIGLPGKGPDQANVISGNASNGIEIGNSGANAIVQNNFIGTEPTGTSARPNGNDGILVNAPDALIGGHRAHTANVISGNLQRGILINFGNCDVLANRIGTNAAGTAAIGNGDAGIDLESVTNVSIGDGSDGGRNIVSGNVGSGIVVGASTLVQMDDNLVGTDSTGAKPIGNLDNGVAIVGGNNVGVLHSTIGGNAGDGIIFLSGATQHVVAFCNIGIDASLKNNLGNSKNGVEFNDSPSNIVEASNIANNTLNGIEVDDSQSTQDNLDSNQIFSNGHLGIKLGADNNTPLANHNGTVAGPNDDQNYPVLTSAVAHGGVTTFTGTLHSTANTNINIEIFSNDVADPSGFGEGQTGLIGDDVTTDANGDASFSVDGGATTLGQFITATASVDVRGDTSEFSQAIAVTGASITGKVFNDVNGNGIFDSGETGLKGRTVFVDSDSDGRLTANDPFFATSDAHGNYRIFGVAPGANRVRLLGTAGFQQTFPSPKSASQVVSVTALATKSGVLFGQEKSTAKAPTLAIDAASTSAYVDLSGQPFAADTQRDDVNQTFAVAGTDDDSLYNTYAIGGIIDYHYAVPNGKYILKLFFAEPDNMAVGQRLFNVKVNGATVIKNLDVVASAGAIRKAFVTSAKLTISNKTLALEFESDLGQAIISAFELIPA
ncbi:MAG TPA: malectin domain-containing carbohydrate-binding protein [Tepidisphaeraceae bacterium]|nr:malectin domain-containing carbohydrate-binding protein [Tepidisphaeraceae bacterium]